MEMRRIELEMILSKILVQLMEMQLQSSLIEQIRKYKTEKRSSIS